MAKGWYAEYGYYERNRESHGVAQKPKPVLVPHPWDKHRMVAKSTTPPPDTEDLRKHRTRVKNRKKNKAARKARKRQRHFRLIAQQDANRKLTSIQT